MPTTLPLTAARIGELLRLQIIPDQPDLTLFDVRLYLADRLASLYPLDYHVYVRRWRGLPAGDEPGRCWGFWNGGHWCRSWRSGRRWGR